MTKRCVTVSSYGRLKSRFGVVKTPSKDRYGYPVFNTTHRGKKRAYFMHQVMGVAFKLPRRAGQNTLDHIKGIDCEYPNKLENLQYADYKEQSKNRNHPANRLSGKQLNEPYQFESEIWKPINKNGFRDYFVSNFGRFRNKVSRDISYTPFRGNNYKRFKLVSNTGVLWQPWVSVVIAEAFLEYPAGWDETWEINHKDRNEQNNRADNLEWVTSSLNKMHSYATNKNRVRGGTGTNKPFRGKLMESNEWIYFDCLNNAVSYIGSSFNIVVHIDGISKCLKRIYKQTKGFVFEYTDPNEPDFIEDDEVWVDVEEWMLDKQRLITSGEYDKMFYTDLVEIVKNEFT